MQHTSSAARALIASRVAGLAAALLLLSTALYSARAAPLLFKVLCRTPPVPPCPRRRFAS